MSDFLAFRTMVTPTLSKLLFWIGVAFCVLAALGIAVSGYPYARIVALVVVLLGPVVVRINSEVLILLFRMSDTLAEIRDNTKR